jgi:hypothetical protein
MSVLPAEVHTALASLLSGLQSPDNVQRSSAEQQLNEEWVAQRPDVLLMGLSEQIDLAQDTSVGPKLNFGAYDHRLTLRVDTNIRRRHLQATVVEAAEDTLRPNHRSLPDPQPRRARGNTRQAPTLPRQRDRQLGAEQDWRCSCRARTATHG